MAKKLKAGKGVGQKAGVLLAAGTMQKNVQGKFNLVKAGLNDLARKKYNPNPEIAAIVKMVDTAPTAAKYVFKQAQPWLESDNPKLSQVAVKIVVKVVKAKPELAEGALEMTGSLFTNAHSSAKTKEAAGKAMVAMVKEVPSLAKNAFGQIQPLLKSKDADVVKMATEIIVKMVKAAPQVEVAQGALEVVQGLLGGKNANSFKTAMKIMAGVVSAVPEAEVAHTSLGLVEILIANKNPDAAQEAIEVIVKAVPEVAHRALGLVKPLLDSKNSAFIQAGVKMMVLVVKAMPKVEIAQEALSLVQILIANENTDAAQEAIEVIVQAVPEVARRALDLLHPLLESGNLDHAQMASKTAIEIVKTIPQVEVAQGVVGRLRLLLENDNPDFVQIVAGTLKEVIGMVPAAEVAHASLDLVEIMIANRNHDAAQEAIEVIVQAVRHLEVAHRALDLLPPLLESGNLEYAKMASKTAIEIVKTIKRVEVAQEVLRKLKSLFKSKDPSLIQIASEALQSLELIVPKIKSNILEMRSEVVTEIGTAGEILKQAIPMLHGNDDTLVQKGIRAITNVVMAFPSLMNEAYTRLMPWRNDKTKTAADVVVENLVHALPKSFVAIRERLTSFDKAKFNNSKSWDGILKFLVEMVQACPSLEREVVALLSGTKDSVLKEIPEVIQGNKSLAKIAFDVSVQVISREDFERVMLEEGYLKTASQSIEKIVKIDLSLAPFALNLYSTISHHTYAKLELAKAIAEIVKAAPGVVNQACELLNSVFARMSHAQEEKAEIILDIVQAVPELAHNALGLVVKSLLNHKREQKLYDETMFYKQEALKAIVKILQKAPADIASRIAKEAFELIRPLLKKNNATDWPADELKTAEEALKTLAEIVKVEPSLANEAFKQLEQEKSLFGTFVIENTCQTLAEIVKAEPSLASVALDLLIPALGSRDVYYNNKPVAVAIAEIVQANPLVAMEVLELVKPLFDKYELVAVEITTLVVGIVPDLANEVVKTIKVLLASGKMYSEFSAKKLLEAMPWLCGKVIKQVEQLGDKEVIKDILEKIQPLYEQHVEYVKGVNAQVQEHLALGDLGVDDALPHVTKALGVIDEYVTFGEVEVV